MLVYAVAFGIFAHIFLWGVGLALCLMPRRWRTFWPALTLPAGLALQNAVVWGGAHSGLAGTDRYALPCEIIPLIFLAAGIWRRRAWARAAAQRPPRVLGELVRWWGVAALAAGLLGILVYPLSRAAKGLTTASLGSCDAADYAVGARVFQEFAHHDRTGFIGLTEVVRIRSVDNFFDFWLKINHFTPSAIIAFNGSIFHCQPHELTGLMPMVVLAASLPTAFWIARALFGLGISGSFWVALLYGLSPVSWYAVYQVAIGQLIAAPAIALLTWAAVALWRSRLDRKVGWGFCGVLALSYSLIWGAYNFMVVVCLVPALAYAVLSGLRRRRPVRLAPWALWVLAPLAASAALFWTRAAGLLDRFRLFQTYDFGWHISALTPEGWLGFVRGTGNLMPWSRGPRGAVAFLAVALLILALWRGFRRGRRSALLAVAVSFPILAGYYYLNVRGAQMGTNASYDGYKLFSVFYPVMLPAFMYWLTLREVGRNARAAVATLGLLLAFGIARADVQYLQAMSNPALIVDRDLMGVAKLESNPAVRSVNLRLPSMWERLWANAFLLRRPQYFETHTYEGRLNTPLRGEWDLTGDGITVALPEGAGVVLNPRYSAQRVDSRYYIRAERGDGWFPPERLPRTSIIWHWTGNDARIRLHNPHSAPVFAAVRIDATSLAPRRLQLWANGKMLSSAGTGPNREQLTFPAQVIPPGESEWSIRPDQPASSPGPGDQRLLAFSIFGVRLDVQPVRR
jgi:hypothetical protein